MYSITGYFRDGSKLFGFHTRPQMSVLLSRPLATNTSGARHPAWRLESKSRDADALYPKVISTIRKDNFVVVAAEVYNRRGERAKAYRVTQLSQVQGIWTVMASAMSNEIDRTRTELAVTEARYNTGLAERDFSRRELENGAR